MTGSYPLVATFPTRLGAHDAALRLREGGFHEMLIGAGPADVTLTVACDDYPELAAEIVAETGGIILSGDTFYCATPVRLAPVPDIVRGVDLSGVVRLSERRKAPRHLAPYKQVS